MSTTETKPQDRKFLDQLTPVESNSYFKKYEVAGVQWSCSHYSGDSDELNHHLDDSSWVSIRRAHQGAGFAWHWTKKLAEGAYASHDGEAETLEAAAAAALAYAPHVLTFDYLTESTWYETAEGRFCAVLDGESANVFKNDSNEGYLWQREWAPAKTISAELGGYFVHGQIAGTAPTPEAAMIACIEAPNRLKAACATLIASLREQDAPAPDAEKARFRAALDEIAHSNRTKTGLKEIAKAALFPAEEAAC